MSKVKKMKMSEAILEGIKRYPRQTFRSLYHGTKGACAIGAALAGLGYDLGTIRSSLSVSDLHWPERMAVGCPLCSYTYATAYGTVVHLNDDHKWTREDIALWLADNVEARQAEPETEPEAEPELALA